jgi:hypothetical protein
MPSSRVLTFSDPYDYAKSARGAHVVRRMHLTRRVLAMADTRAKTNRDSQ